MSKTLVITEKKSVADDFARVLGGAENRRFKKESLHYESDDLVIAWASGHLLELQEPGLYDKKWRFWRLDVLPIIPETFVHVPRERDKRSGELLDHLVRQIRRDDVDVVINGCDAGREGELIFSLILDHAKSGNKGAAVAKKQVRRLWLQSMTTASIRASFRELREDQEMRPLRNAAYTRDQADWLVGMNATRALTKRFLGGGVNRVSLAVGRVKTPTLAFLVDREREIDSFIPVPFFQISAAFSTGPRGTAAPSWEAWWAGKDAEGKATDRIDDRAAALAILAKIEGKVGRAEDSTRTTREKPPQLFDLTALQRRASSAFGFTLKRTLAIAQTLYESKKAITYPRTSSSHLPNDYRAEVPRILEKLSAEPDMAILVGKLPDRRAPEPEIPGAVFDDKKVSDHFALIPTGEIPRSLKPDEQKVYDLIVRRFIAAFMPSAVRETTTRKVEIEGEVFKATSRHLVTPGWRAIETVADDDLPFPPLDPQARAFALESELVEKETSPPSRYTDGTLVGEMETSGKHVEDEEQAEALKDIGIGTPATRAAIVEDLIYKQLARRDGRTLVPTALGSTLVRLVRNLNLEALAKPDLTGLWEQRLNRITEGRYDFEVFRKEIVALVESMVGQVKSAADGPAAFAVDHPPGLACPKCKKPIVEKAYSYFCSDEEGCGLKIHKDVSGKHLFPEVLLRLTEAARKDEAAGPFTGFERPRSACLLRLDAKEGTIKVEPLGPLSEEERESLEAQNVREEQVPDGTVMGQCPKCGAEILAEGAGYRCAKKEGGCDFRLSKKLLFRELPPDQVRKMLAGPGSETDLIQGFISKRGRPFGAQLLFDEKGKLQWKFPPRPPRAPKAAKAEDGAEKTPKPKKKAAAKRRSKATK